MGKSCLSLACLPVVLVVACGGAADLGGGFDASSDVADAGASDASCAESSSACLAGDASPNPTPTGSDGGLACTVTADCSSLTSGGTVPYVCGYPLGAGCAAQGTCLPAGPLCNMITQVACACSGSEVGYGECSGYPNGYAGAPTVHTGACDDASVATCQTAADCGANQVCVQDYDPQVGPNPVSSKCIDDPCGTAPLSCTCAVTAACYGFSVNCAIGSGGVVECLGNG
jgi:hypothetical protein